MKVITVDGANGGLDTNYEGKANAALDVLTKDGYDFVYVHLEGPDEMGHQGSVEKKVKAIERLDERIIRPIAEGLAEAGRDFRMVVLPDHPTPISLRTHTADNVPYLLYDSTAERSESWHYNEREAAQTANFIPEGHKADRIFAADVRKSIFLFRVGDFFCVIANFVSMTQKRAGRDAQNTIDSLQEECYICYRLNG